MTNFLLVIFTELHLTVIKSHDFCTFINKSSDQGFWKKLYCNWLCNSFQQLMLLIVEQNINTRNIFIMAIVDYVIHKKSCRTVVYNYCTWMWVKKNLGFFLVTLGLMFVYKNDVNIKNNVMSCPKSELNMLCQYLCWSENELIIIKSRNMSDISMSEPQNILT